MTLLDTDLDLHWEYGSGPIPVAIKSTKIKFRKTCHKLFNHTVPYLQTTSLDPSLLQINEKAEMSHFKNLNRQQFLSESESGFV